MAQTCKWLDEMQQKLHAQESDVSATAQSGCIRLETVERWQREQSQLLQQVNAKSRSVELLESTLRRRISKCCDTSAGAAAASASVSARTSSSSLIPAAAQPPTAPKTPAQHHQVGGGLLLMAIPPIPEESEPADSATPLIGGAGGVGSGLRERERPSAAKPKGEAAAAAAALVGGEGRPVAETDARLTALADQLNQLLTRWTAVWDLSHRLKRTLDLYHSHLSEVLRSAPLHSI